MTRPKHNYVVHLISNLKKETAILETAILETGGKLHGDSQRRAAPRLRSPK
ncbi:MAG: hypothetical protein F6K18_22065 [Okeania sp. SIO2C2]|uniref:hypothetical protein n=1 Tax=Okeania sp. SIO2C2 TaxID=2607787 RepID=UPI0013BE31C9|nr:hypothetical protein [Okeania sp. SIO2C2]NEP89302.1 hypothetical protein [Okeania sp. SIO2C2]